jgi:hypothetical protein
MRWLVVALAACSAPPASGFDGSVVVPVDAPPPSDVPYAHVTCSGTAPSFAHDAAPIFTARCSGADTCHLAFAQPQTIRASIVGVAATETCHGGVLVAPSDLAASYLMNKLTAIDLCPGTLSMPYNGQLPLDQIQIIADWICSGALDN